MKNLQKLKWILVLFLALLTLQACDKDELIDQVEPEKTAETDNSNTSTDGITSGKVSEEGRITLYKVEDGNLTTKTDFIVTGSSLEYQKDTDKHKEIWALAKKIIPHEYLAKLNKFVLVSVEDDSTGSDADAFVNQTSDDASTWELGIDIGKAYKDGDDFNSSGDLGYIIVHELGHIITGDETQIDTSIDDEKDCQNYFAGSGCAKKDSYQNIFHDHFWADIWSEFTPSHNVSFQEEQAFYEKYKDRFVSQYAASNPVEDIAETFATFVTEDENTETGISKKKVEEMYANPKLVKIRNFIRGNVTFNN